MRPWVVCAIAAAFISQEVWSGEIVLEGGAQAARAREALHQAPGTVSIEVVEEDSIFPQHGGDSLPNARSGEMRDGARERQSGTVVLPQSERIVPLDLPPESASREGVVNNLSRSRAYMKNAQGIAGLPVVACDSSSSVSGRIGDDSLSGSIITLIVNGKPVKARCR